MSPGWIALPSLCLTCGYGQTSRSNREFDRHECADFRAASPDEKRANASAHQAEMVRRRRSREAVG